MGDRIFVGLDVGTRTIGVARASERGRLAGPVGVVRRRGLRHDVPRILEMVAGDEVLVWVVGLPLELDGAERRMARLARQVGEALAAATGRPVAYQDERFTSLEAQRRLVEAGVPGPRRRERIDAAAAAVILQDWLDAGRGPGPEPGPPAGTERTEG